MLIPARQYRIKYKYRCGQYATMAIVFLTAGTGR